MRDHRPGTEGAVKPNRRLVPVEDGPLQPPAVALDRHAVDERLVARGRFIALDALVSLVERRLMVWQPRSGETERI